ncbi:Uncharacterised protein [uncultured Ruminococcus sp.]|nr:Uncharacterised protein [uncultured Ruminococcus sp.]
MTENGYVHHIKQGPGDIRDKDCPQAAAQVVFVGKGLVQGLAAEHAEGRQEEEGRYGKPRQDFQYGDEPQIRRRIGNGYGADVNADDAEHAQAAHIIDGMNKSL